ncbi:MAG: flagellar basal body L-ring protein FlgH [Chitinispirillales bacterium]|jgi:flagellar L-ring protein precursor FlgH|nr:flagellar basal body L-ring protein FlgH [Chitinispirillales bacterium]
MIRFLRKIFAVTTMAALGTTVIATPINSLFSDHRAMRVDDILTIIIVESAKAGSESRTNTAKASEAEFRAGSLNLISPQQFGTGYGARYDGKGATSRSGSLTATVTARVIEVLASGNLVIEGSKVVEINQEREIIKISGIVRPQDIQKNNVVLSTSIADAEITYSGNGVVNTAARPGFFTRFFNWLF